MLLRPKVKKPNTSLGVTTKNDRMRIIWMGMVSTQGMGTSIFTACKLHCVMLRFYVQQTTSLRFISNYMILG